MTDSVMPSETTFHQETPPQALTALDIRLVRGANAFAWSPVVRLTLDLGAYDEVFTNTIEGFREALQQQLPSLYDHQCSVGKPGGFFQRVQEGTLLGHVLEHIALELQVLGGMDVTYGKTRRTTQKGVYNVVFSYIHDEAGILAARSALEIVNSLLSKKTPDIAPIIVRLKAINNRFLPSYSTQALTAEARRRSIPLVRLDGKHIDIIQLGTGKHRQCFEHGRHLPHFTSGISTTIGIPKTLEKEMMSDLVQAGILPQPKSVNSEESKDGAPPLTNDYRILLLNGGVPRALKLAPPIVAGDGKSSIQTLVDVLNRQRHTSGRLQPVAIDTETLGLLAEQDYTPESIPHKGAIIRLKRTGTLENGGAVIDMTDELSAANTVLLGNIAQHWLNSRGIILAELHITTPSLRSSLRSSVEEGVTTIRTSLSPDMALYQFPTSGRGYNIAQNLLAALFPPEKPKHIPILAVTAGIGGDLLATMLDDALTNFGYTVGRATPQGLLIRKDVAPSPISTANSVLQALTNPALDCIVAEIPLETITRDGIQYDRADVGIVLNIDENAAGEGAFDNALETREDVAHAHALVAEYIHDDGVSVLNANNPLITRSVERHDSETIYFATARMNPRLLLHCSRGGKAVLLDEETMFLREGKQETLLVRDVRLDAALDKDLLLALTSSLLAFGIPLRKLQSWLKTMIERISDHKKQRE